MKIERIGEGFAPTQITLETYAEAEHLWHKLNNVDCQDFNCYVADRHGLHLADELYYKMWMALDDIFTPKSGWSEPKEDK